MMLVIGAGKLDRQVKILEPIETLDDYGDSVVAWQELAESPRRASIRPLTLRDQERLGNDGTKMQQDVTHQVVMRFHADINAKHRLEYRGRTLEIAAVSDVDTHGRMLEILCREVAL